MQGLDHLVRFVILLCQRCITWTVNHNRLHAGLDSSLDFLDIVTQEQNAERLLAEFIGNGGVAGRLHLQTRVRGVEPVTKQSGEIPSWLLFGCSSSWIRDIAKQQLLCKDAARGVNSKVQSRCLPVL